MSRLILIPGLASDAVMWQAQLAALPAHHHPHVTDVHHRHTTIEAMAHALLAENDGELVVARPAGNTFDVVKRYTVANSQTWAHPIIDGKRIIVRGTDGKVTTWTLP